MRLAWLGLVLIGAVASDARAICRVVVEIGSPPPMVDPAQSGGMIYRRDAGIGQDCKPRPPSMSMDLAVSLDDGGALDDGGGMLDDGGGGLDGGGGGASARPGPP